MSRSLLFFFTLLSAFAATANSEDLKLPRGTVCWPLHFAGITLGITTDPQVQRLLGQGVSREAASNTGERYYIDKKSTATMHVVSFTDYIVGEVTIVEGIAPAIAATDRTRAVSQWFNPDEGFGNWHSLRLGSTKDDVLKNLGAPEKKISANEWQYSSACACELPEFFTLSFKDGRLVKIVLSAPPG